MWLYGCRLRFPKSNLHINYSDVIMGTMASQITSFTIVYSTVYSDIDQRKHQSSASLTFVRGNHRWPVNSPHKGPVTRKMFPFDNVILIVTFCTTFLNYHFQKYFDGNWNEICTCFYYSLFWFCVSLWSHIVVNVTNGTPQSKFGRVLRIQRKFATELWPPEQFVTFQRDLKQWR